MMRLLRHKPTPEQTLADLCSSMELELIREKCGNVWLSGYEFEIGYHQPTTEQLIEFASQIQVWRDRIDSISWSQAKGKSE